MSDKRKKEKDYLFMERNLPPSHTSSKTSILSRRSSGRVTPEDSLLVDIHYNSSLDIHNESSGDVSPSSKISSIEVNPLYRKSSLMKPNRGYLASSNNSLDSPKRSNYPLTGS